MAANLIASGAAPAVCSICQKALEAGDWIATRGDGRAYHGTCTGQEMPDNVAEFMLRLVTGYVAHVPDEARLRMAAYPKVAALLGKARA